MMQPIPEMESGIGPGSALRIQIPAEGTFGCTANFIWTDDAGSLYLGTAGHCVLPDGKKATDGPGADYDASGVRVSVRTSTCPANTICGGFEDLGAVVYARNEGVGKDFAIVRIPDNLKTKVRHEMPMWGGPTGEGTLGSGQVALHYGHGVGLGEVFATRGRTGIGTASSDGFGFLGTAILGDSGSAVVRGGSGAGAFDGREAVGILTHIGAGTSTVFGTRIDQAKLLVGEHIGLRIWTLPGGAPLPGLPEPTPGHINETLPAGDIHLQLENNETTTLTITYSWNNSWSDVRVLAAFQTTNGSARLVIKDSANTTLLESTSTTDLSVDRTLENVAMDTWTIQITFEEHVGLVALRIENGERDAPGGGGGGGGHPPPGVDHVPGNETEDGADGIDSQTEALPAPTAILLAALTLAALAVLRRRHTGPRRG
jgi:hypothetical protein